MNETSWTKLAYQDSLHNARYNFPFRFHAPRRKRVYIGITYIQSVSEIVIHAKIHWKRRITFFSFKASNKSNLKNYQAQEKLATFNF